MHRLDRPPDEAIEWAAGVVGERIAEVSPLTGGMSTGIHLLTTASGERVVMRRFLNPHWLALDPHLARREAEVLRALESTAVPAPALVGVDAYGETCGSPTVLMGFVPGRRLVLDDHDAYARELAHGLALVHDVAPPAVDGLPDTREILERTIGEETTNRHGAMPTPAFWARVREEMPDLAWPDPALIHDDLHPGNVLFDGDRLSAIVDWPLAASGPPACDVAFCRLDTGMMLGLDVADAILAAYEAETGSKLANMDWWDLYAASRAETDLDVWTESYAGLAEVDLATVQVRFDDFVRQAR